MKNLLYIGNKLQGLHTTVTTISTLSNNLKKAGYNVIIASGKKNQAIRLLDMLFHIVKYRKQVDYVLIDTYSTLNFYYAYLCAVFCRFLNLKYVPILHGGNLPERLKTSPKLSKAIFKNAAVNIAPSLYIKSIFEDFGFVNITCIPNFIDIETYCFKKREFKKVKLLWVRSFSKIYNPLLAVKVVKALKDVNIEATLCMVGPDKDGSLQATKKLAKKLHVDVKFTGKLSKEAWITLSKDYNIFINTTNFDNMPVSVIEAMALGLPVISTQVGGMPFLIEDGVDGILVKSNDEAAFVKAIKTLMSQEDKTKKIAELARKKVENFDWEVVKKQWLNVLS
ncbi:glycosyl transferase family 1 [Seonamhaeicola sp. S2-3]|uniref:glycosyltransferase family 4 protein n=1 Tax=Seonamhaeicola sp. S2-3 TaxID=1936081 RepID=UPI000972E313|nr:glycosyltransferase family 4 protein [Seonamhaeicola sp. S2-3]APY09988.1 glycosyl transferase family 1 [Seonamhaeicola sp. S2-3]